MTCWSVLLAVGKTRRPGAGMVERRATAASPLVSVQPAGLEETAEDILDCRLSPALWMQQNQFWEEGWLAQGSGHYPWAQQTWVQALALPPPSRVTWAKSLSCSGPQFPHVYAGGVMALPYLTEEL